MLNSSLKPYEDLSEESSQSKINFAIKNLKEIKISLSDKDQAKSIDMAIDSLRRQKKIVNYRNHIIGYWTIYKVSDKGYRDFLPCGNVNDFIIKELI